MKSPSTINRKYGWKPSIPDHRDFLFKLTTPVPTPPTVDPLTHFISAYDQGNLGSCTGNGCARLLQHRLAQENQPANVPSRLFIYYGERELEGDVPDDNGAQIRDGMKVLATIGAPPEVLWPYDISQFATKPSQTAYAAALQDKALKYSKVPTDINIWKQALASGNPIVFGFTVFASFESPEVAKTGIMPMPMDNEDCLGGHCVVADGYDDVSKTLWVANSWGTGWGINGWFRMPYANMANISDPWILTVVG